MAFGKLESHFLGDGDDVGEEQCVDAFALVFGKDGHKQEVDNLRMLDFQGLYQMPPSEGEQFALGLLQGMAQAGDAHAHCHGFALLVLHDGEQTQVEELQILVHIFVNLPARHFGISVERCVGTVYDIEDLVVVSVAFHFADAGELADMHVGALLDDFRHAEVLVLVCLVAGCGYHDFPFHPVDFVGISVRLHVAWIIGVVVDGRHGGKLVETVDEHAFSVHIGESEGADNLVAAMFTGPFFGSVEQCLAHFQVVDEVNPSESTVVVVPDAVGLVVLDACHTSHNLSVAESKEKVSLTEGEGVVALGVVGFIHILQQIGHRVGIFLVEFVVEADECLDLLLVLEVDSFDFYCHLDGYV